MKVLAKQNRELIMINAQNTQNENDAEKILLQVPEQYEDFNKKIVFVTPDGIVWDIIVNNEYLIQKAITKYKEVQFYIWLTKDDIDFRSQTKTLKFYHNVDASNEITPEEISGVNTVINLLEEEITKVDNMDIDAVKVGDTATITITDKNGISKSVEVKDGQVSEEQIQEIARIVQSSIDIPENLSDLNEDSTHRTVTDNEKSIWNNKQEALVSGTNIKTINNQSILGEGNINIEGGSGTTDYSDLENKPKINNVELNGNKSLQDLGITELVTSATTTLRGEIQSGDALRAYACFTGAGVSVAATPENGKTWGTNGVKSTNQYRAALDVLEYTPLLKQITIEDGYLFYVYGNNEGVGNPITKVVDWVTSYTFPRKPYKYYFILVKNSSNTSLSGDDLTDLFTKMYYDEKDIIPYVIPADIEAQAVTLNETTITTSNYSSLLSDFNNALINRIYSINGCADVIQHTPYNASQSKSGTLVTFNGQKSSTNFTIQIYATKDDNGSVLFMRYKLNNMYYAWKNITGSSNVYGEEMGNFVATCIDKSKITGITSSTKILAFGDSIVAGVGVTNSWLDNVASITGCTVVNKAIGGALYGESVKTSSYWISTQIANVTSTEWSNANLIIIGAGTNDAGNDTPYDELKAKIQSAITSIKANTNAPILLITPIRRGANTEDSALLKLPMVSGIICNVAVANQCSVINGFDIPIPTFNIGQISDLTQDHLHPNEVGAKVYAQAFIDKVGDNKMIEDIETVLTTITTGSGV